MFNFIFSFLLLLYHILADPRNCCVCQPFSFCLAKTRLGTMWHLLTSSLLAWLIIGIHSAPHDLALVNRRDETFTEPIFTTRIRLANGTDVSTSFHTMVYWQPDTPAPSNSSLNSRQFNPARRIQSCSSPTARFIQSHCTHARGLGVSLQDYTVFCQELPGPLQDLTDGLLDPLITIEEGACGPHELCVDEWWHEDPNETTATCVDFTAFLGPRNLTRITFREPLDSNAGDAARGSGHGHDDPAGGGAGDFPLDEAKVSAGRGLGNRRASVIVSAADGSTPLGLQNLEVDLGVDSGHRTEEQQTCHHCFGLRTQKAATDADFLMTKATLLATTAVTGLVWITIFAG